MHSKLFNMVILPHDFFSNGSGTAYAAGASYTANAGTTLYAQWRSNDPVVGDYVAYTPPNVSRTVLGTTFNPSNTTSWRIFSIDNGVISIIPTTKAFDWTFPSNVVLTQTWVSTIALGFYNVSAEYADSNYVDSASARHLGMTASGSGSTYTMNAVDKAILTAHPELNYSGDTYTTGYKTSGNAANGTVWIEVIQSNGTLVYKHLVTDSGGEIIAVPGHGAVLRPGDVTASVVTAAVRPVLTLKSTVRITGGNGTQASPYTLGLN